MTLDALVVTPEGTVAAPRIEWALCDTAKTPSDPGPVSPACLADGVTPVSGSGASAEATLSYEACRLFGPEVPPPEDGEPPGRPRDADVTGGYYQPVRLTVASPDAGESSAGSASMAFAFERLTCNLANAAADVAADFMARYSPNTNPRLDGVTAAVDGGDPTLLSPVVDGSLPADVLHVPAGSTVHLVASWPAESVESYPVYDLASQTIVDHREAMRVSWYTTAGVFLHERGGREETDAATTTANDLTVPAEAGVVHLWVVLRDSRGGVDFAELSLVVD